jgi:hypothetical protein
MKPAKVLALVLALVAVGSPSLVHADARQTSGLVSGLQGYAGPGWAILFGPDAEMLSLGPVMFRVSDGIYLGPTIAYSERASEGPGSFLGGVKVEAYLGRLSRGFYSTSVSLSALAGASGLNQEPGFAARLDAELDANLLLFPAFSLAVGPVVSLRLRPEGLAVLGGVGFSVKESTLDDRKALLHWGPAGPRVGGYWQGLWIYVNGALVFVDGGGTRVEFPGGVSVGITGGVLRQKVEQGSSDLAIMLSGVSAEWNAHLTSWLTVTPRVVTGIGVCLYYGSALPAARRGRRVPARAGGGEHGRSPRPSLLGGLQRPGTGRPAVGSSAQPQAALTIRTVGPPVFRLLRLRAVERRVPVGPVPRRPTACPGEARTGVPVAAAVHGAPNVPNRAAPGIIGEREETRRCRE